MIAAVATDGFPPDGRDGFRRFLEAASGAPCADDPLRIDGGDDDMQSLSRLPLVSGLAAGLLALALAVAAPATAAEKLYKQDDLGSNAVRLEGTLKTRQTRAVDAVTAKKDVDAAVAAKDPARLEEASGRLIVANPKDWTAWNRYAIAAAAASGTEDYSKRWQLRRDSHAAAYRAYQLATQPKDEAQALTTLADTYVFDNEQRTALIVLRSALKTAETPAARQLYERLRPEFGFKIDEFKVDSDASSPRACFTFTEDLKKADYAPYVAV